MLGGVATAVRAVAPVVTLWVACLLALLRFLPAEASMPVPGLDGGWGWAVSQAAALGLRFGPAIVFTYGPYGALVSLVYEPALRGMMIVGGAVLGAAFAGGLVMLRRPFWALAVALSLAVVEARDLLLLLLPVPAIVACMGLAPRGGLARWQWLVLGVSAVALGLLPLTKLSLVLASAAALCVLALLVWRAGAKRCAVVLPCIGLASFVLAWLAIGQAAADLPAYVRNGSAIIAGYNTAMENPGVVPAQAPALLADGGAAVLALLVLGLRVRHLGWRAWPVWTGMAVLVFTAWKSGVVRAELGRMHNSLTWFGMCLLLLAATARWRLALVAGLAGAVALVAPVPGVFVPDGLGRLWRVPAAEARGAWRLVFAPAALAHDYARRMARLEQIPFSVKGSADIYSFGQSLLLASPIGWAPRPVLQSYSAYTPALAALDRAHLAGPAAPDNVFFRPEPIDGRLASLEDGLSWPLLLSAYAPAGYDARTDYLWLRRAAVAAPEPMPGPALLDIDVSPGETVTLPDAAALWGWIDARPSTAGRVQAALYRLGPPRLALGLDNGGTAEFNTPAVMLQTGFLLSPLVRNVTDFLQLRPSGAGGTRVRTLSVRIDDAARGLWRRRFHLRVEPIAFPPAPRWPAVPEMAPRPVDAPPPSKLAGCVVDTVNGGVLTAEALTPDGPLIVNGWAAYDLGDGLAADHMELEIRNASGGWAVPAFATPRADVASALRRPGLAAAGFRAAVDTRGLPAGIYQAWLVLHRGASETGCATSLRVRVGG